MDCEFQYWQPLAQSLLLDLRSLFRWEVTLLSLILALAKIVFFLNELNSTLQVGTDPAGNLGGLGTSQQGLHLVPAQVRMTMICIFCSK